MTTITLTALHYVDYSAQGEDSAEMIAEIVRLVHAYNREHGNVLGLDFPGWVAGESFAGAQQVRVFGEKEQLAVFIRQPRAVRLMSMGDVARSMVARVPVGAGAAAVVRDSAADKNKPSHARRRERRGVGVFSGERAKPQFGVAFTSKSTGQEFLLKMKKRVAEAAEAVQFNSYGLCLQGGVPQF